MAIIEKNISSLIENQFPEYYREEGPLFVEFVKKYYEWMEETNNPLYHARRISDYKDLDSTVDEFIIKFKEKFLKNIQIDTAAQTKQLIKHSLDLYRSKGTERSVDLFFRAIFGKPAEIYYPSEDIFRLSDGEWVQPKYLEVTPSDYNKEFVGKQIIGLNSRATAFVERYIKRKVKDRYINILYISAINGEFETGELLSLPNQALKNIPTVVGSLTTATIITGGIGFKVGDLVTLDSTFGSQGLARVVEISDVTGTVSFILQDSGWGYTTNAEILVSDKVLTLENVIAASNNFSNTSFYVLENIKQPLANIIFINANNTWVPTNNDLIYSYYSNNAVKGTGRVLSFTANGATNGEIFVAELVGNLDPITQPNANLAGNVSITSTITALTGLVSINTTSNLVTGNGTSFNTQLVVGSPVYFFAYDSNNNIIGSDTKIVSSITNATSMRVNSNLSFASANASAQVLNNKLIIGTGTSFNTSFVYGSEFAIFSNATNYIICSVNNIINSTYMTVQSNVTFSNTSARYANTTKDFKIYNTDNTISANISTRTDKSVTANIIGVSSNVNLLLTNTNSTITNNEFIYLINSANEELANGKVYNISSAIGANVELSITNARGIFNPNNSYTIRTRYANGTISNTTAKLSKTNLTVGVVNITGGNFVTTDNNFIYGINSTSNATLTKTSSGVLSSFKIANTLQYQETVTISSYFINDFSNILLNAAAYGFASFPTANASTNFLNNIIVANSQFTIGGISALVNINPGKNYDTSPFVLIYEPTTSIYNKKDFVIETANNNGVFSIGELIQQGNSIIGQVRTANLTHTIMKRLRFNYDITLTNISGVSTGFSANVVSVSPYEQALQIGVNAIVDSNVQTSNGSVTTLQILDSGFGYKDDETAIFTSEDESRSGTARISLGKKGISKGFYKNRGGFVSDDKKIFDGEYYQEYSYEIRSSISFDKYADMLKNIIHVAGTKTFSSTVVSSVLDTNGGIKTNITVE